MFLLDLDSALRPALLPHCYRGGPPCYSQERCFDDVQLVDPKVANALAEGYLCLIATIELGPSRVKRIVEAVACNEQMNSACKVREEPVQFFNTQTGTARQHLNSSGWDEELVVINQKEWLPGNQKD